MNDTANSQARWAEWRARWPLPLAALIGTAGSGVAAYSTGVFMEALTGEFGWSRSQYLSAMTGQLLAVLIIVPLIGRAVDRFGPRRVALAGLIPAVAGMSSLGLANGDIWQWRLLNVLCAIGACTLVPPVWVAGVVRNFHASRGLALAVCLAGIGTGTALWPVLAAAYIPLFGWRLAYAAMALTWAALAVPLTLFFFRDGTDPAVRDQATGKRQVPVLLPHLLSRSFLLVASAGGLFVIVSYTMVVHLVPILRAAGLDLTTAASLAGITGLCSIAGRLTVGLLLDHLPTRAIALTLFMLPALVCLLLYLGAGSTTILLAACILLGFTMGGESDVLGYIASRRFDPAVFGSLFSTIQTVTAVTGLGGTMIAGYMFDLEGTYTPFFFFAIPVTILATMCIMLLPREPAVRLVPLGQMAST